MGNACRKSACMDGASPRNSEDSAPCDNVRYQLPVAARGLPASRGFDRVYSHLEQKLLDAAKAGSLASFEELVRRGADLQATDLTGKTALAIAAERGHTQIVRYLVAQIGVDCNRDTTALLTAAETGQLAVVSCLVEECGADVNTVTSRGHTALMRAAENGHCEAVRYLAERGADVDAEDRYGSTAIMEAASRGYIEVVRYLVEECGVDVNAAKAGTTPLMEAVGKGHLAIVQYLAEERGVDVNSRNEDEYGGLTVLMKAVTYRHADIVRYLVERGSVDVDMTDLNGNTALMWAASSGYVEIVRYLAEERGADVNVKNANGETALQRAAEKGYQEIQSVLTQFLPLPAQQHTSDGADSCHTADTFSRWAIPPSEVALVEASTSGNIGYRAKWLDADAVVKLFVPVGAHAEFEEQVELWGQLRHPNVIKMYGACKVDRYLKFFVGEYASRGSLLEHIESSSVEEPIKVWRFLYEAALGLEYLHERGVVHGDLRCSNVLVGSDGRAKLSNFELGGSVENSTSGVAGPTNWQAPELLFWRHSPSLASDVYSLGMCIVEAVTRERPWGDEPEHYVLSSKRSWTPERGMGWDTDRYAPPCPSEDARALLRRMCCHDAGKRASISSVVYELECLAIKESMSSTQLEHSPPDAFDDYMHTWDDMKELWTDVEMQMKTCKDTHYCRVFGDIMTIRERLQHPSPRPALLARFNQLLTEFNWMIKLPPEQAEIMRLSSTRATSSSFYAFHWRIQSLLAALGDPARAEEEREVRWQEQRSGQADDFFVAGVTDAYLLLQTLKTTEERSAFLRRLKTQIDAPVSNYTPDQRRAMKMAYSDIVSKLETEDWAKLAPEWFIPWYELVVDKWSKLGSGGFGSVYQATWLDSEVVVKLVGADDAFSLEYSAYESQVQPQLTAEQRAKATTTFRREADIWFRFNHPHVVRLFGACHVGRPFFVCEYATNGTLVSYLRKNPG